MKKTLALLLAVISLLAGMCGCEKEAELPTYETEQEMMIGAWLEPADNEEAYTLAKEMGITHLFLGGDYSGGRENEDYWASLELAEKTGLKILIRSVNQYPFPDQTDYTQYPSVVGINYWDEPFQTDFAKVAALAEAHMQQYGGDLSFFINLPPNETNANWKPWPAGSNYQEYVNKFCTDVLSKITQGPKILSSDVYPFVQRQGMGDQYFLKSTWLACVEQIALSAREIGADTHFFIQAATMGNAGDYTSADDVYPVMTEESLRYQFAAEMAFGIRNFTYFTYNDYGSRQNGGFFTEGMINDSAGGTPREQYYFAKTVNAELEALKNVYLSFSWQGTLPFVGTENSSGINANFIGLSSPLESIPFVNRLTATQDTLFGSFRDENGTNALMVTNFSNPFEEQTDSVRIEFKDASKAAIYTKGECYVYEIKNNLLEFALEPGQGAFVIAV